MTSAVERILSQIGHGELIDILGERIDPTDLQTLLLAVYQRRSASRSPATVLADYERSRFFGASAFTRAEYAAWQQVADRTMAGRFEDLVLSPMAPLGTCSSMAAVGQDWSVPTVRTGEVVSDPTNVLGIEAALRRRKANRDNPGNRDLVHLATTQRVVRPQAYADPRMLAHFELFALVSAGRDTGNHGTEAEAIDLHLDTLLGAFHQFLGAPAKLSVSFTLASSRSGDARLRSVQAAAERWRVQVWEETERASVSTYYSGFCFHIWAEGAGNGRRQLADGGTVDWIAKLLSNGKERALISGCGVEGLLALRAKMKE